MAVLNLSKTTSLSLFAVLALAISLTGCQKPKPDIDLAPLPYEANLQARQSTDIDIIVIHATETPTLKMARELGEKIWYQSGTGNSGHYYIDRDGAIYQYVDDLRIAHHVRRFNKRAIGIEIINSGRYPNWYSEHGQMQSESYTKAQINALVELTNKLALKHPSITTIAGHEDLDPDKMTASDNPNALIERKVDPGPFFPWFEVIQGVKLKKYDLKEDHLGLFTK